MLHVVLLSAALCALVDAREEAVKKEMKALEGKWVLQSIKEDDFFLEPNAGGSTLVFSGATYSEFNRSGDKKTEAGTFTLDPSKSPHWVDFAPKGGQEEAGRLRAKRGSAPPERGRRRQAPAQGPLRHFVARLPVQTSEAVSLGRRGPSLLGCLRGWATASPPSVYFAL